MTRHFANRQPEHSMTHASAAPSSAVRRAAAVTLALATSLLAAAGCNSKTSGSASTGAPAVAAPLPANETGARRRVPAASTELLVKKGHLPLRYLITRGSVVRVNDVTTDRQLLRKPVPNNTIVLVDPAQGVKVNDAVLVKGPLAQDHQYELIVERSTE
jgi:hypothetical protein